MFVFVVFLGGGGGGGEGGRIFLALPTKPRSISILVSPVGVNVTSLEKRPTSLAVSKCVPSIVCYHKIPKLLCFHGAWYCH